MISVASSSQAAILTISSKKSNHLVFTFTAFQIKKFIAERDDRVVDSSDFRRINAIFVYNRSAGQIRNRYDMVGVIHAVFLYSEHRRIRLPSGTVEFRCMHMYHQRFAGNVFGMYSRRISEPVMRMNHIAGDRARNHSGNYRIIVDLFEDIVRIAA